MGGLGGDTADINFYTGAPANRAVKRSDGDQYCRVINNTRRNLTSKPPSPCPVTENPDRRVVLTL